MPTPDQTQQLLRRLSMMRIEAAGSDDEARSAERDTRAHLAPILRALRAEPDGTVPPGTLEQVSETEHAEMHARLRRAMNQLGIAMIGEVNWLLLVDNVHKRECVPFLGAGASLGFEGAPGLPTAGTIARRLAQFIRYPGVDKEDFLRVCQYYELMAGKSKLRGEIADQLRVPGVRPGLVHSAIASLPFNCVLTTNYDSLMERAFQDAGKEPSCHHYDMTTDCEEIGEPTEKKPLVYKLHGSIERETTMVCTEDDVVQFLSCMVNQVPELPSPVRRVFQQKSLLFIGYGLKDWNIRVMLRALRRRQQKGAPAAMPAGQVWTKSYALQLRPHGSPDLEAEWKASVLYWDRLENVRCFDLEAAAFLQELARLYHKTYPAPATAHV